MCSISLSGDVNPCSFLGPSYAAANLRGASLAEIWHESQGFRAIRALPGGGDNTFHGGCRARALVLSGSINAPDPWIIERDELSERPDGAASRSLVSDPLDILELRRECHDGSDAGAICRGRPARGLPRQPAKSGPPPRPWRGGSSSRGKPELPHRPWIKLTGPPDRSRYR